jgi:hypothetical protein
MITPILENLVIQGLATVNHKTVGQNGVSTISVPQNQSIVITKISIQPFINPSFNDTFGPNGSINQISDAATRLYGALINLDSEPIGLTSSGNIVYEMLKRGTFQIELISSDNNRSIFTFGTDFNFVYTGAVIPSIANPPTAYRVMLLPALSERSTDCYSVHKNNVHVRLRFINSYITESNTQFTTQFKSYQQSVSDDDLNNTIPENREIYDINSNNLFFNTAVYSQVPSGNFGFYPFGIETNYANLKQFNSSDTITFPYFDDGLNVPLEGRGGEASFYSQDATQGSAFLLPYLNAFIPYINIEYVLINEKADGQTLVNAKRYNTVTINK